jgi:hypothetical protein
MATQTFPRISLRAMTCWRKMQNITLWEGNFWPSDRPFPGRDKNSNQEASDQDVHRELKNSKVCEVRSCAPEKVHIKCIRKVAFYL